GQKPWILQSRSLERVSGDGLPELLAAMCEGWSKNSTVVASEDLRTIVVQDQQSNPVKTSLLHWTGKLEAIQVPLPDPTCRVQSVHGTGPAATLLLTSLSSNGREFATTVSSGGTELAR